MSVYQTSTTSATLQRSGAEFVAVLLDKGLVDDAYLTMRVQFDEGVQAARNGWPVYDFEPAARRMGYIAMAERLAASDIDLADEIPF